MSFVLRTLGLAKRYGKTRALVDLALNVPQGAVYGFLGRNGAGKTTTLRIAMGIVKPDAGNVELFGVRGRHRSLAERRRIGFVSQEPAFYPWMSAVELGRFVAGFYPSWDAPFFGRLLKAFDVAPEARSSALSGGTRAKLALALALGPRPELLILDEPTAGLDPVARREFLDIVLDGNKQAGHTVLFSSHLIDEVERVASIVGVLEAGSLRYEGSPTALVDELREVELRGQPVPLGFHVVAKLRRSGRTTLRAPPALWETAPFGADQIHRVPLEEAFLALVSRAADVEAVG